jgi:2-polyprenyl-3-methyl-5-hydroxy-6-metoxy-1,4-benzoquinol methylase
MTAPHSAPDPAIVFDALNAYQRTEALKAAIELDLFSAISAGPTSAAELAGSLQATERGVRILSDFLVICGLLTKENGKYGLTPTSATFLDRKSSSYLGGIVGFVSHSVLTDNFKHLATAVRTGRLELGEHGTTSPDFALWVDFAKSMIPLVMPAAMQIPKILGPIGKGSVLDIAAGHGMFGIAIAQENPEATITAMDWSKVLDVAEQNARAAGVGHRYRRLNGDAFQTPMGGPYDAVLLTNFLHHFDHAQNVGLLKKVRAALKPEGKALTLEFVPNPDRVTPPVAAAFALMMLGSTPRGDAYTFQELEAMFHEAGFAGSEAHELKMSPETLVVSRA